MSMSKEKQLGGLKGFFTRAASSFYSGGLYTRDVSKWLAKKAARVGFIVATSCMVTLVPLLFEMQRETQSLEMEKSQVKDLRGQGYSDRQLQEIGFSEAAVHNPSVAVQK